MLQVKNLQQARAVWQKFHFKYAALYKDSRAERVEDRVFSPVTPEFMTYLQTRTTEKVAAADRIKRWWWDKTSRDTFINVKPDGQHRGDVKFFLHKQHVKKSLNREKLSRLEEALAAGDWSNAVFDDASLPHLALTLYMAGNITQQQIYTILERHQTLKDFPLRRTCSILDAEGQFTKEAEQWLLPVIGLPLYLRYLSNAQLENFRWLVATLPKSEQVFYLTYKGRSRSAYHDSEEQDRLGDRLVSLDIIYLYGRNVVHLTSGVRDALGLVHFGLEDYVRPMPRLGVQSIADIEDGVRHYARYVAICFPGTRAYGNIHDYPDVLPFEATSHDVYHSQVMSAIPNNFLRTLWRLVDISREKTGYTWSKEIWAWIDAEYGLFFQYHRTINVTDLSSEESTALFCEMLYKGSGKPPNEESAGGSLIRQGKLTPLGILAFIDMLGNREEWLALNIDPELLISPFYEAYETVREIYDFIKQDNPEIQVLKCEIYFYLVQMGKADVFALLNAVMDENKVEISEKLKFRKRTKGDLSPEAEEIWVNAIFCSYDNQVAAPGKLRALLSMVHRKHHTADEHAREYLHYEFAVLSLKYNLQEAERYAALRVQNISDKKAQFRIRPNLAGWVSMNPCTTALGCVSIVGIPVILGLAAYKASQQKKLNQSLNLISQSAASAAAGSISIDIDEASRVPLLARAVEMSALVSASDSAASRATSGSVSIEVGGVPRVPSLVPASSLDEGYKARCEAAQAQREEAEKIWQSLRGYESLPETEGPASERAMRGVTSRMV